MSKNLDTKIRETKDLARDDLLSSRPSRASTMIADLNLGDKVRCHTLSVWKTISITVGRSRTNCRYCGLRQIPDLALTVG